MSQLDRIEAKLDLLTELVAVAFGYEPEEYEPARLIIDVPDIATYEASNT